MIGVTASWGHGCEGTSSGESELKTIDSRKIQLKQNDHSEGEPLDRIDIAITLQLT